ncbi:hypothetical protein K438DRAFT_1928619 [Mycena galopus ATCC 62051]|nr:hypothetical protein K438DRAFT_1928619 [Mycena galopus ATCC 62051]
MVRSTNSYSKERSEKSPKIRIVQPRETRWGGLSNPKRLDGEEQLAGETRRPSYENLERLNKHWNPKVVVNGPLQSIELEVQPGRRSESEPLWTKTTRSRTGLELNWKVQVWNNQFTNPRTAEYTVSGRPVAWESAIDIHDLFNAKWASFAKGHDNLIKKKANNGPATSMFLAAHRSVFLPNVATQDEVCRRTDHPSTMTHTNSSPSCLTPICASTGSRGTRLQRGKDLPSYVLPPTPSPWSRHCYAHDRRTHCGKQHAGETGRHELGV